MCRRMSSQLGTATNTKACEATGIEQIKANGAKGPVKTFVL